MENIAEYIPPGSSAFLESRTQTTVPVKNTNKITVTTKSTIPLINNVFFIIFPSDREMSFRKSFNFLYSRVSRKSSVDGNYRTRYETARFI